MPDIALWHRCNNHCLMCTNSDAFIESSDEMYDASAQISRLLRFSKAGDESVYPRNGELRDYILFTGGEPTLHPDFLNIISQFRESFPALPLTLLSNGRTFAYSRFAGSTLIKLGRPATIAIPIHGYDAKTHDSITRTPGSFTQTLLGLSHLLKFMKDGQELEIRFILHKRTIPWLGKTLDFLLRCFPAPARYRLVLIYFEMEGQSEKNFQSVAVPLQECVSLAIEPNLVAFRRFHDFRIYHFPLCTLPEDLRDKAWNSLPSKELCFPLVCHSCALNEKCMGIQTWYPKRFGTGEFEAIK